ncbi:MAG: phosphonate metabolism protein/1,5-bisphosphokinase (PRPP-forming) PhnN [Hyphomicrobiaceae bacterium]
MSADGPTLNAGIEQPAAKLPGNTGLLVLVVGPSGAGKDTLLAGAAAALAQRSDVVFARRVITRASHGSEDHDTVSAKDFDAGVEAGRFLLSWRAHGLGYALGSELRHQLDAGRIVIANVSRDVVEQARAQFPNVRVVLIDAPADVRHSRLLARGRETPAEIELRLSRAIEDVSADVIIVNDGDREAGVARLVAAMVQ